VYRRVVSGGFWGLERDAVCSSLEKKLVHLGGVRFAVERKKRGKVVHIRLVRNRKIGSSGGGNMGGGGVKERGREQMKRGKQFLRTKKGFRSSFQMEGTEKKGIDSDRHQAAKKIKTYKRGWGLKNQSANSPGLTLKS